MSLARTPAVIVGGGPAGLLAALLLARRGWRDVTVLERAEASGAAADPLRGFSFQVARRGLRALGGVDGLVERLVEAAVPGSPAVLRTFPARAPAATTVFPGSAEDRGLWLRRGKLLEILEAALAECGGGVRVVHRAECLGLRFGGGACQVVARGEDGREMVLPAGLVLACDGTRSVVRASCERDAGAAVESASGFGLVAWDSGSSGLRYRALEMPPGPPRFSVADGSAASGGREEVVPPNVVYAFKGDAERRAFRDVFNMYMLPVGSDVSGGRAAIFVCRADHPLWDLRTADAAYKLLEDNFPQLADVRAMFSAGAVARFVAGKPSAFSRVQRCRSLVGLVRGGAGVVMLGDAAHAFPPDAGQGVNCALEDVSLLCEALDAADAAGAGLHDALARYERGRDEDVSALVRLATISAPYQYGQSRVRLAIWAANVALRKLLATVAPRIFHPQASSFMKRDLRYSEILALVNATTRRIWMLAGALLALSVVSVIMLG